MEQMRWRRNRTFCWVFIMKEKEDMYQKWIGKSGERWNGSIKDVEKQVQIKKRHGKDRGGREHKTMGKIQKKRDINKQIYAVRKRETMKII